MFPHAPPRLVRPLPDERGSPCGVPTLGFVPTARAHLPPFQHCSAVENHRRRADPTTPGRPLPSGVTVTFAHHPLIANQRARAVVFMWLTGLLGITFLGFQAYE